MDYYERQDKARQLQACLASATEAIDRAKQLSNELGQSFSILGRTYTPLKVVSQGGHFDHEPSPHTDDDGWDESNEDSWQASGIEC